jgi:creatinine amidohydrolase
VISDDSLEWETDMKKMEAYDWSAMTAPELNELARKNALVFVPVGSVEQHGPHLSTGTDAILAKDICYRVAQLLDGACPVVVTPALWFGLAGHHLAFGGTFTVSLDTYKAVIGDLCRSIAQAGFKRIVLVNGHGGNIQGLASVVSELACQFEDQRVEIATTTYFMEAYQEVAEILEDQDCIMHACEGETSMMMVAAPNMVRGDRIAEGHGATFDMIPSLLPTLKTTTPFEELTASGVSGSAAHASAEKGEALLSVCSLRLAERLKSGQPWRKPLHAIAS